MTRANFAKNLCAIWSDFWVAVEGSLDMADVCRRGGEAVEENEDSERSNE